jgi:Holliday junction resolvase RusA-like endonuclease
VTTVPLICSYTIPLDPRTKKNHQMIAGSGQRCPYCGKHKKQFIRQGKAHSEYIINAYPYLMPKPVAPISAPVRVQYLFYMGTRRKVDSLNLCAAADDLLVEAGVLEDDNSAIIKNHDGTRVLYDKQNPRTEIYIHTFEEDTA